MKGNFRTALNHTLKHEGGFANHPRDPGGTTMKGVTLNTFRRYYGQERTVNELKAITHSQLCFIYRHYWDAVRGDELPAGVDYAAFDAAVNSGPRRSIQWLQQAAGVANDGLFGPNTRAAIADADPVHLVAEMCAARLTLLRRLETWDAFGRGWRRRAESVLYTALDMAEEARRRSEPKPEGPMERWSRRLDRVGRRLASKFGRP